MPVLNDVSWSVLPLVAGLFILVEGINRTGVLPSLANILRGAAAASPHVTSWIAGVSVAIASNLIKNLPMGIHVLIEYAVVNDCVRRFQTNYHKNGRSPPVRHAMLSRSVEGRFVVGHSDLEISGTAAMEPN
jgi:Citrate transporter